MNNYTKIIEELVKHINNETIQKVSAITELFQMLDIEPMEEFKIKVSDSYITDYKQRITYDFYRQQFNEKTQCWETVENDILLGGLLAGAYTIVKIPKFTEAEQKMIEVCKMLGAKYIAKDYDEWTWAYSKKPVKDTDCKYKGWSGCSVTDYPISIADELAFNSLNWKDTEPYYIGE